MINPFALLDCLLSKGVTLFTGVPDSLLNKFNLTLETLPANANHIITANEGGSIGIAIGSYLATGIPAVVYMQNSGLGNAINPLTSLADKEVYGVPIFLIIGWRGDPSVADEPQHIKQGKITPQQLELLDIKYRVVDKSTNIDSAVNELWSEMIGTRQPVALLIKNNVFTDGDATIKNKVAPKTELINPQRPSREEVIEKITNLAPLNSFIVASTGKAGRELYEIRERQGGGHNDFLTVGGMGHASLIALGVAISKPSREVICLDGDGALLMHLGSLTTIGLECHTNNLTHVLLNNGCHESVGGQPTAINDVNLREIVTGCNYEYYLARSLDDIEEFFKTTFLNPIKKIRFLDIHIAAGSRSDLGRPKISPSGNKSDCMNYLNKN